jgi:hypothetical protein
MIGKALLTPALFKVAQPVVFLKSAAEPSFHLQHEHSLFSELRAFEGHVDFSKFDLRDYRPASRVYPTLRRISAATLLPVFEAIKQRAIELMESLTLSHRPQLIVSHRHPRASSPSDSIRLT